MFVKIKAVERHDYFPTTALSWMIISYVIDPLFSIGIDLIVLKQYNGSMKTIASVASKDQAPDINKVELNVRLFLLFM